MRLTLWKAVFILKIIPVCLSLCLVFLSGCSDVELDSQKIKSKGVVKRGVSFENVPVEGYTKLQLEKLIKDFSHRYERQRNLSLIDPKTWEIKSSEAPLYIVDEAKTVDSIMNSFSGQALQAVLIPVSADEIYQKLQKHVTVVGEYSTAINTKDVDRTHNIRLAMQKIHLYRLQPKQEFSFNQIVGKRTQKEGYRLAPTIIKTEHGAEKGDGVGGGICQLSSTLYNAVEQAGCSVLERHPHSKKVDYVPEGRDAAVAYEWYDFRFCNTRSYPILMTVEIEKNTLIVRVYENTLYS